MIQFLHGALFLGYAAIALFFLRFWLRSGDRLFLCFAIAFALTASSRAALGTLELSTEVGSWVYWLRLIAYLLILAAIIDTNWRTER